MARMPRSARVQLHRLTVKPHASEALRIPIADPLRLESENPSYCRSPAR